MKWDPFQKRSIINIYHIYQVDTSPISLRDRDKWILLGCPHLLYPQQIAIEFDHLMIKF
jgi:hypothetical protein